MSADLDSIHVHIPSFTRYILTLLLMSFQRASSSHLPGIPGTHFALQTALVAYTEKDPSTSEALGGFAFPVLTILRNDTKRLTSSCLI